MEKTLRYILLLFGVLLGLCRAEALPAETYASESRLSAGRWVKISVKETGIHYIPADKLRQWGFADAKNVRVYGYGGARISDRLDSSTYIDDLPQVQSVNDDRGIYFYAQGPYVYFSPDRNDLYTRRSNPYSTVGYYFLCEDSGDTLREIPVESLDPTRFEAVNQVVAAVHHESDLTNPGESGHLLLGEDFRFTPQRSFSFEMPDRVAGSPIDMRIVFFSKTLTSNGTLNLTANGISTGGNINLNGTTYNSYGDTTLVRRSYNLPGDLQRLQIGMNYSVSGSVTVAALDYFTLNYRRTLRANTTSPYSFLASNTAFEISGADASTVVWDVTDPLNIKAMQLTKVGNASQWANPYSGMRTYAVWHPGQACPVPELIGNVANQNLHGEPTPDMIIVSPAAWLDQAERLAQMHRESPDSLRVLVVEREKVFNEFGSGVPDVNALRRMFKFFYDRGTDENGSRLQFALLMSRPSFDHRGLTDWMRQSGWDLIPTWQTDGCADDSYSYCSDDIIAMLEDGSGTSLGNDILSIAVGRFPVRNHEEARLLVDKTIRYATTPLPGEWKNRFTILADDQDNGVHLEQAEDAVAIMQKQTDGGSFLYNKVYVDAYEKIGGVTQGARDRMYRLLDEGSAWWWYIGHASIDTWTSEGMLTRTDLRNRMFFKRPPILYAPTCTFSRWDGSGECGVEMLINNSQGGVIASLCPTRPVYISANGVFTRQVAQEILQRDEQGRFLPVGEIFRRAKNRGSNDTNRLRYVFAGDPALRVPTPANRLVLTSINGIDITDVEDADMPAIAARSNPVFEGYVADADGNPLTDFNGTLHLSVYDAEESVVSLGRGDDDDPGKECPFDRIGGRLYAGRDAVTDGHFSIKVAMPSQIAENWRPAALNMYAIADDNTEASGMNRRFYVYGYDETSTDDTAPLIEAFYLNHESFRSGDTVNDSPMAFAVLSDDIGINLSQAGIGHTLLMRVDNLDSFIDVSDYYVPASDGSPRGTVAYPISGLTPGNHTIDLRVWDTSDNLTTAQLEFFVDPSQAPEIYEVTATPNPASEYADFYVAHNRPDQPMTVRITVYDIAGRAVWSRSTRGRSDMFISTPITWNLTDEAGRRVPRGIYVYRAEISTDGENYVSAGRRIAVTH